MKVETPQILWHNGTESDNGKAAPLYSCSLLPFVADGGQQQQDNNTTSGASASSSSASSSASSSRNANVLATVGNTPEIHLWEVGFSRSGDGRDQKDETTSAAVADSNSDDQQNATGTANIRRPRILQSSSPNDGTGTSTGGASGGGTTIKHIQTLSRQIDRSLNAVKFSPDGRHLAAAGDGGVVLVFTLPPSHIPLADPTTVTSCSVTAAQEAIILKNGKVWSNLSDERNLRTKLLPSPSTHDVMDLSWSSDSKRLVVGCLDHTVVTYENVNHGTCDGVNGDNDDGTTTTTTGIFTNDVLEPKWITVHRSTSDHLGYVQGVAFDPNNVYLASMGSDRTVRVWSRKKKKVVDRQKQQLQMQAQAQQLKEQAEKIPFAKADPNATNAAASSAAAAATTATATSDASANANSESGGSDNADNTNDQQQQGQGQEQNEQDKETGSDTAITDASNAISELQQQQQGQEAMAMSVEESPAEEDKIVVQARSNLAARKALTHGKFELGKAKIIKFRDNANKTSSTTSAEQQQREDGETTKDDTTTAAAGSSAPTTGVRRNHLFGDESTVESFFRRLSWTPDGAFLICPAALWHCENKNNKKDGSQKESEDRGPSYATCLFSRHGFDQPCRVLAGLEKPSVVVRPSPVLFKLPPNADSSSKENNCPAAAGGSVLSANGRLPYRSIFAVLTLDSVVIYDTHHARPLCIARGLHYAGLTDAVWSADGRTLMVTSTDGYISILSFADGELGEVYVPPVALAEARVMQEEAAKLASRTIAKNSAAAPTIPPCEPGQSAVIVAPPAKKAKTDAHAPVSVTPNAGDGVQKSGKKRVVPSTILPVGKVEKGVTNLSLEGDKKQTVDDENNMDDSSDAASAAMTISATEDEPNVLQPKKKKKRVQPVLVSCD